MKILLFFPHWTESYGIFAHFAKRSSVMPPLNLAYIAAVAEKQGHEVKIVDCEAENVSKKNLVGVTALFKPDIIGTTSTTPCFHIATDYVKELNHNFPKIPIIIGGNHITVLKEKAFNKWIDYGFVGEAEESWSQFLKAYANGQDISQIKGILYRDTRSNNIEYTGDSEPITDLDSMPLPARHLLNMDLYKLGTLQGRKNCTNIMATRGCPFKCIFCSTKVFGNTVRKRSPKFVVDEMVSVVNEFKVEHFYFLDDTLTVDKKYILELCSLIESKGLDITFEGSTRANLVDEEIISRMAKAGLIRLCFGLEAVDSNIRKIMRKEIPLQSYTIANRLTNKYNIETLNSCMIGLPGETIDTIRKLLHFYRNSKEIKQSNIAIAVPYPGTELYEMAKNGQYGVKLLTNDFSKFLRYGAAVMSVGSLSPDSLVKLQNDAFVSIFMAPWRIIPVLKKQGILGGLLTFIRFLKSFKRVILNKNGLFRFKGNWCENR